ncbi:MAG: ATP-binding protein [Planctomycetes bacterium]|nr:ATP-binding protein [Planctomycetota bacterium]
MADASKQLFESLRSYRSIETLIENGEAESLYLECKSPGGPKIGYELTKTVARCVSAFSNAEGGVILWGVSTTHHKHDERDILTQIEPIGKIKTLESRVAELLPRTTRPSILNYESKIIQRKKTDTRGLLVSYIPKTTADPLQASDEIFYFRSGSSNVPTPFEMIRRMFATAAVPDLHADLGARQAKRLDNGNWTIPLIIINR